MRGPTRLITDAAQAGPPNADPDLSSEALLIERRFRRSSIAFYLRTVVRLTEEDLQVARHRTLLGLIPLGRSRCKFPVDNVERISAATRVSIGGLVLGVLLVSIGLIATMTGSVIVEVGAVSIALGALSVLRSPTQAIDVRQAIGGSKKFGVAVTERHRIVEFAEQTSAGLEELHRRRGPVDLSAPRRRWRRRVLVRRLASLGIVVAIVAGGYGLYKDADFGFWVDQQIRQNNSNDGHWDLPAPSGRAAATIDPSEKQMMVTAASLPHLQPIQFPSWGYETTGIDAYPSGLGDPAAPKLALSGYLLTKEKQRDGTYLFGVEVPYLDGSLVTAATGSTTPSCKPNIAGPVNRSGAVPESALGGVIVWLRIFPATDTTWWPMETQIGYGQAAFAGGVVGVGEGVDVMYEYTQIGDPIRVEVDLGYDFNSAQAAKDLKTLVDYRHASNAADARAQIEAALGKNMKTWQTLSADCGRAVPLADQLQGKRNVLSPITVAFLPVATE